MKISPANMTPRTRAVSRCSACSLALTALCGALYATIGPGLLAADGVTICRDLQSSGSNDDIIPAFLVLLVIPAAVRVLFRHGSRAAWELPLFWLLSTPFLVLMFLITDCASLWVSIAHGHDIFAALMLLLWLASALLLYRLPVR